MISAKGYGVHDSKSSLSPFSFERRELKESDILIDILYCGVCHSDIHQVRNEWNNGIYPMVPGHEIVGKVTQIGNQVTKFQVGDIAAVGCLVDSCRTCSGCQEGLEQYCVNGFVPTYNGYEKDNKTITFGGYSDCVVVDDHFALKVTGDLELSQVAPLLCAGITTYSPLRHWGAGPGKKVGIIGLGGLGHMALKFAYSFGAEVVLFTTSPNKKEDALRLGASQVINSKNQKEMDAHLNSLDLIINTVSASIDLNPYLELLHRDGTLVLLGVPDKSAELQAMSLIFKRRSIAGSLVGGLPETQEMLNYCVKHNITSDVEVISIDQINHAYERMIQGDVKYRFVIDLNSLKS